MAGMGGVAEYPVLNNTIIHWEDGGLFLLRPWVQLVEESWGERGTSRKFKAMTRTRPRTFTYERL